MTTAGVVLVDDDLDALGRVGAELSKRYGGHYEVITHHSTDAAMVGLRQLKDAGRPVALVLADLWMPCMTGIEFLALAYELHPTAKRVLLTDWGDTTARALIVKASALDQIDCDVAKPVHSPDESFHQVVTGLLAEWAEAHAPGREVVRVIGAQWLARCHELRDPSGSSIPRHPLRPSRHDRSDHPSRPRLRRPLHDRGLSKRRSCLSRRATLRGIGPNAGLATVPPSCAGCSGHIKDR
jgi:FixJ family two-component response regulator